MRSRALTTSAGTAGASAGASDLSGGSPSRATYPNVGMPLVHHAQKEVHLKVVYYGPGLGGKTTNVEAIHQRTRPERRGKLISLASESERTLFFDLLPVELGTFKGYSVRLHLYTVPGQFAQDRTRKVVLRHVDGIVFIVDSQVGRVDENLESVRNLQRNLSAQGDDPERLPLVIQYNKRDLPGALPLEELRERLGVPPGVPEIEGVAIRGVGVFETMKAILKEAMRTVGDPSKTPEGRSRALLPKARPPLGPSGTVDLAEALEPEPRPSVLPELVSAAFGGGEEPKR
jgi:signal recognition particle receptor subunit beta